MTQEAGSDLDSEIQEMFFGAVGRNEPKPYSTDLTAAGSLLEQLHKKGWFWRLDSVPNGIICTVQCLTKGGTKENPERLTYQVGAATLPLAICLAALKTI